MLKSLRALALAAALTLCSGLSLAHELLRYDLRAGLFKNPKSAQARAKLLKDAGLETLLSQENARTEVRVRCGCDERKAERLSRTIYTKTAVRARPVPAPAQPELEKLVKAYEKECEAREANKALFMEIVTPFIMRLHDGYASSRAIKVKRLPRERAQSYASAIYDAGKLLQLPLRPFVAKLAHEAYFVNIHGDLDNWIMFNGKPFLNYAESLCQITVLTKRAYWNDFVFALNFFKKRGINVEFVRPEHVDDDLTLKPELAIWLAAFIFKENLIKAKGDVDLAIQYYNAGAGRTAPDYRSKVEATELKLDRAINEWLKQIF